ncbi:MAG: hypothetical protein K0A90_03640 [Methanosarcinaceae archaeon]|nr:hypothetical protein [Methanosarcinaceae archaeon]
MQPESNDQPAPNLAERFILSISKPENLARILRWAWLISLAMLVLGYLIIFSEISPYLT